MSFVDISDLLESYNGRDKIIRLLCYSSKLGACVTSSPSSAEKLDRFASQLSACRALLRLFDDIPMLRSTLSYGLGRQEKDPVLRSIDLMSNIVDQAYYPIEHIAWAIENDFLSVKSNPWSTRSTLFWVMSIYLSLMRNVRCIAALQYHKGCLNKQGYKARTANAQLLAQLLAQQQRCLLSCFKCCLDLVHAVHSLPEGILWGGKLKKWHVGTVGTVSSAIGLYMTLSTKSS